MRLLPRFYSCIMHKNHVKYKGLCTICMQKSICVSTGSVKYIHDIYKGDHSGLWVPDFCPKTWHQSCIPAGPAALCVWQP